jgi:hypothetical protein
VEHDAVTDDASRPDPERGRLFLDALDRYRARVLGRGVAADLPPSNEGEKPATPAPSRLAREFRAACAQRATGQGWRWFPVEYGDSIAGRVVTRWTPCAGCRRPLGGTNQPRQRGDGVYHPACEKKSRGLAPTVTLLAVEREERARRGAAEGAPAAGR